MMSTQEQNTPEEDEIHQRQLIEEVLNVAMNMGEPERRKYLFDNYTIIRKLESKHP